MNSDTTLTHRDSAGRNILTRREFSFRAGAMAAVLGGLGACSPAQAESDASFEQALARVLGKARPAAGPIKFDIPEHAENGMMVAYTISVESPMTENDFVRAVHLLSSGNIKPVLSVFRFSAASGRAHVAGRIRLAKTQKVFAIAELSGGRFLMSEKTVNVTVGSCG